MSDVLFASVLGALMLWLFTVALTRPRLLTYGIFALGPTQFIFIPVFDFFLSPADVLVVAALAAFMVRLARGERQSLAAAWRHRALFAMLAAYLFGFAALGIFSRTLIRVVLAVVPSMLACETLRQRGHFFRAEVALVLAGVIDAGYGIVLSASGHPLHPTRFSGMSGVNFSAAVIMTAAVIVLAWSARARRWSTLMRPGALLALGAATLSQMGAIALVSTWAIVLRRIMTRRNVMRLASAGAVVLAVALLSPGVRERLASRSARELQVDGVERNSADIRWLLLETAWTGFEASPFVGLGFSQFQPYSTTNAEINRSTRGVGYGTHNTYVEVLVEGGVLAFVCLLLHFGQYASGFGALLRVVEDRKDSVIAGALAGLPVVLVSAALANVLLVYHFWSTCGLALACLQLRHRNVRMSDGVHIRHATTAAGWSRHDAKFCPAPSD